MDFTLVQETALVDYVRPFADLLQEAGLDDIHPRLMQNPPMVQLYPCPPRKERRLVVVSRKEPFKCIDVPWSHLGLREATAKEGVALITKNPELQRHIRLLSVASVWQWMEDDCLVPSFGEENGRRYARLGVFSVNRAYENVGFIAVYTNED